MTWIERPELRGRGSRNYYDSLNPNKGCYSGQAGTAWHYKSDPDGEAWDTEVDLRPQHITAGGHDGWVVTANSWHYFLGQPNGLVDGFVGFGGRQGDKWLLFLLMRAGYLHWPTRTWDDIGGSPTYDRGKLNREDKSTINTVGEEIHVETLATWEDLWPALPQGQVNASWRADGNRLKEEITVTQAAREWIAANRPPSTPIDETYFGFVFRLGSALDINTIEMDLSYLERWLKSGLLQDTGETCDFDDDDGTSEITVQNALEQFLFLLPIDEAFVNEVGPSGEIIRTSIKLRKRIYKENGNYYLLVGARVDHLNSLPAGDVIFDPSVDYQVGASTDDAYEGGGFCLTNVATANADGADEYHGFRWQGVTIPSGATITLAEIDAEYYSNTLDEPHHTVDFEDGANPPAFSSAGNPNSDISNRTGTTASITYGDGSDVGASSGDWFSDTGLDVAVVTSIVTELQATYDYSAGLPMVARFQGSADGSEDLGLYHYDNASVDAAKLHIEYEEEATTTTTTTSTSTSTTSTTSTSTSTTSTSTSTTSTTSTSTSTTSTSTSTTSTSTSTTSTSTSTTSTTSTSTSTTSTTSTSTSTTSTTTVSTTSSTTSSSTSTSTTTSTSTSTTSSTSTSTTSTSTTTVSTTTVSTTTVSTTTSTTTATTTLPPCPEEIQYPRDESDAIPDLSDEDVCQFPVEDEQDGAGFTDPGDFDEGGIWP